MTSIIKVDTIQDQDGNNIINENADTITIGASGDTITIPAGATLSNLGTATGFASIAWQSSIVTAATLTAVSGNGYWINTTSNACTITLPASAAVGDTIVFVDYARTWGTNAVTIDQNSLNFQGNTSPNPEYNTDGQSVSITYSGATQGWIPTVDDDVTLETPQPYDIDFLVIAGGGGGGGANHGGGGGAGGYRTSTQTGISLGTVITVTVGDGGTNGTYLTNGGQGSDSSISGSGLTTITSAGGGLGVNDTRPTSPGASGGSGGGGSFGSTNTGGAGNTPSTSPSQGNNGGNGTDNLAPNYGSGGGGGAGGVGGNGTGTTGGNGGNGTASSITGSSVTRAGGGGGSSSSGGTPGTGGTGGGGDGSTNGANATAGTINTGSGGGASGGGGSPGNTQVAGAGGKGVVILSMPDASYSGTTTGSPTVATGVSGKTVLTFTGSGSYTS
jgi:hypothetical protein